MTRTATALLASLLLLTPGCASLSLQFGGGSDLAQTVELPTLGEELVELQRAHEGGATTDDEYRAAKQRLLECSREEPSAERLTAILSRSAELAAVRIED